MLLYVLIMTITVPFVRECCTSKSRIFMTLIEPWPRIWQTFCFQLMYAAAVSHYTYTLKRYLKAKQIRMAETERPEFNLFACLLTPVL